MWVGPMRRGGAGRDGAWLEFSQTSVAAALTDDLVVVGAFVGLDRDIPETVCAECNVCDGGGMPDGGKSRSVEVGRFNFDTLADDVVSGGGLCAHACIVLQQRAHVKHTCKVCEFVHI
jgi:hypothetical protein